jgi:hypothetical protein
MKMDAALTSALGAIAACAAKRTLFQGFGPILIGFRPIRPGIALRGPKRWRAIARVALVR